MQPSYTVYESTEHCHRCGELGPVTVRLDARRPDIARRTAICRECDEREHPADASGWATIPIE